jgi:anti-sigma factor RsiW
MNCETARLLLQAELDGELDAAAAVALGEHVADCAECATLRDELAALSLRARTELTRHAAPDRLRQAILAMRPAAEPRARRRPWGHGASFAAGMALAAGIAVVVLLPRAAPVPDLVAAHIRALQPGHLMDVVSTDQHTVKPWFDGRLDYAPPVRDFAAQGFPLIGGRLDYVAGRPVAVLAYRRAKHLIDLFVWPGTGPDASRTARGYNVVAWSQDGMAFRAVSDLNASELQDFAALWRATDR